MMTWPGVFVVRENPGNPGIYDRLNQKIWGFYSMIDFWGILIFHD